MKYAPVFSLIFAFLGCKSESHADIAPPLRSSPVQSIKKQALSKDSILSNDLSFIIDSVLAGRSYLFSYLKKYQNDKCLTLSERKKDILSGFDGVMPVGSIRLGHKTDSVFTLNPLGFYCDVPDGMSYYFTDTTLPRLETDSYCCHPNNIFVVADIDEDGIAEIAQWHSSCTSRFKGLLVWSLKDGTGNRLAHAIFLPTILIK
jgi:hypothetical protein